MCGSACSQTVPPWGVYLRCILQQVRDHALDFRRIKSERSQLVIGQEIECQAALLKTPGPEPANFREAGVHVAFDELHAQFASFEHAERQEILNELLQALPARKHVAHHFALAIIERAEFLALQQFDVAVQEWRAVF